MAGGHFSLCTIIVWLCCCYCSASKNETFDENYISDWGHQQFTFLDQRREAQIMINQYSGGGFRSKVPYISGYFKTSLKIPKNGTGIATTFYLTSLEDNAPVGNHDELDFELLGRFGPPYVLNTNVFAGDSGNREQQFNLWFDPTTDFHDYAILWNLKHTVFYVDKIPVRVFVNYNKTGAHYPNLPMYVHGSLWNATQWLGQTDWNQGPFYAKYRSFETYGCTTYNAQHCDQSPPDVPNYWNLTSEEQKKYESIRSEFMIYDYCKSDLGKQFQECLITN